MDKTKPNYTYTMQNAPNSQWYGPQQTHTPQRTNCTYQPTTYLPTLSGVFDNLTSQDIERSIPKNCAEYFKSICGDVDQDDSLNLSRLQEWSSFEINESTVDNSVQCSDSSSHQMPYYNQQELQYTSRVRCQQYLKSKLGISSNRPYDHPQQMMQQHHTQGPNGKAKVTSLKEPTRDTNNVHHAVRTVGRQTAVDDYNIQPKTPTNSINVSSPAASSDCDLSLQQAIPEHKWNQLKNKKKKQEKTHHCEYCGFSFKSLAGLSRHLKVCGPFSNRRCPECLTFFRYKTGLERHMRLHTMVRVYECSICKIQFGSPALLSKHIQFVHLTL